MTDSFDSLPCKYKVGFLFKRVCGRTTRIGCPHCKGGPLPQDSSVNNASYDPYYRDRSYYYDDRYNQNDFTDYDARRVSREQDTDYETDLDAS